MGRIVNVDSGDGPDAQRLSAGFAVVIAEALQGDLASSIFLIGDASDGVLADVEACLHDRGLTPARCVSIDDCPASQTLPATDAVALLSIDPVAGAEGRIDQQLGTACRLFPMRLLVRVVAGVSLAPADMFAFGFRCLAQIGDDSLYEYRLSDYKTPPDWLNARYWANPERFALDAADEEDDSDEEE